MKQSRWKTHERVVWIFCLAGEYTSLCRHWREILGSDYSYRHCHGGLDLPAYRDGDRVVLELPTPEFENTLRDNLRKRGCAIVNL